MVGEKTFGDLFREIREKKGMTQLNVAEKIGTQPGYIADIEKGRRTLGAKRQIQIAAIFRLTGEAAAEFFDKAAEEKGEAPADIARYIMSKKYIRTALRIARDYNASPAAWTAWAINLKGRMQK